MRDVWVRGGGRGGGSPVEKQGREREDDIHRNAANERVPSRLATRSFLAIEVICLRPLAARTVGDAATLLDRTVRGARCRSRSRALRAARNTIVEFLQPEVVAAGAPATQQVPAGNIPVQSRIKKAGRRRDGGTAGRRDWRVATVAHLTASTRASTSAQIRV